LDAVPRTIISLGSSSFGATRPEFNLLDLYGLLSEEGLVSAAPVAVSLGGSNDLGQEFPAELRQRLIAQVAAQGLPLILEGDLRRNVARRMGAYLGGGKAGPPPSGRPAAFVNIGGNQANLGVSPKVLEVPPGLSRDLPLRIQIPDPDSRGVLFEMADLGVPIIHLLHVRGLALRYGLPWDPLPLPPAGTTRLKEGSERRGGVFWILTISYFGALFFLGVRAGRSGPFPRGIFPRHWVR
jgi:poly-gamma-glutamate system protein